MTKQKTTKRALLMSGLALLMCVSMFVGSTFAWFTDSVKTGVNTIQAGTLDIVLEYEVADGVWENAEGKTLNFKKAANAPAGEAILWEPGCTYELPAIRVRNNGNLALKYNMVINGIDGDAKLLEAIEFTANGGAVTNFSGELLAKNDDSGEIVIKGHMKEEAGNEYQGLKIEGIGITVFATQFTYEKDSYDENYDKMATVDDIDELNAALAEDNVKIILGSHIALTETLTIPAGKTVAIDLAGFTISGTDTASLYSLIHVKNGGNLTIMDTVGTGKVTYDAGADKTGAAIWAEGNLVLNSGIIEITGEWSIGFAVDARPNAWGSNYTETTTFTMNGGAIVASDSGVRVNINSGSGDIDKSVFTMNGGKINSVYDAIFAQHNYAGNLEVIVNDGTITSGTHAIRIFGSVSTDIDVTVNGGNFTGMLTNLENTGNGKVSIAGGTFTADPPEYLADGYAVTARYGKDGDIFTVAPKTTGDNNTEKIVVEEGAKVELEDDNIQGTITNNGGELTVTNTTVHNVANHSYGALLRDESYTEFKDVVITNATGGGINLINGEAIFESGIVDIQNTKSRHLVYVGTDNGFAKLTIKGGTFNLKNKTTTSSYLVAQNTGAVIIVEGGIFNAASTGKPPVQELGGGEVIIKGGTFEWDPTQWVADGYEAVENSGVWTVSAK